ncbi:hypothetical protein CJ030_MR5G003568 [Morella rubra]|uniref:Uncharacterized protein n=1 Tax=Morella rubra TaxID=262757 RepID=A0A6A1VKA1_9ROSI|nr:hypothetical protein CJ030_MR5G003568 [Morella rubra]
MATGGKLLRCDSSARSIGASNHPETRAVVTPSNGADDDLPSPVSVNLRNTSQSSYACRTRWIALEKARIAGKLRVHIPNGRTGGDDVASSMLSSHIGLLIQSHVSFDMDNWFKVSNEFKSYAMNKVLEKMEALQLQHEFEGRSFIEVEIFAEVLGTKVGYVVV